MKNLFQLYIRPLKHRDVWLPIILFVVLMGLYRAMNATVVIWANLPFDQLFRLKMYIAPPQYMLFMAPILGVLFKSLSRTLLWIIAYAAISLLALVLDPTYGPMWSSLSPMPIELGPKLVLTFAEAFYTFMLASLPVHAAMQYTLHRLALVKGASNG